MLDIRAGRGGWLFALVIIAVIALGGAAGASSAPGEAPPYEAIGRALEGSYADDPMALRMIQDLQRLFPEEWRGFLDQLSAAKQDEAYDLGRRFMASFLALHRPDMAQAPTERLASVVETQLRLAKAVQAEDPGSCARVAFGSGIAPADRPKLSRAGGEALADFMGAQLEAAAAGKRNPVQHEAFGDADYQALIAALARQDLDDQMIDIIDASGRIEAPPEVACRAGLALLESLASLPAEAQARLMAQAARAGAP
jgi:hypothetical protein